MTGLVNQCLYEGNFLKQHENQTIRFHCGISFVVSYWYSQHIGWYQRVGIKLYVGACVAGGIVSQWKVETCNQNVLYIYSCIINAEVALSVCWGFVDELVWFEEFPTKRVKCWNMLQAVYPSIRNSKYGESDFHLTWSFTIRCVCSFNFDK